MSFSLETWQQQLRQTFQPGQAWLERLKSRQAPYALYGFLGSMALWPLAEALGSGQLFPVVAPVF